MRRLSYALPNISSSWAMSLRSADGAWSATSQGTSNRWPKRPGRWKRFGIMDGVSLGIYTSVPFCRTKCSYCNFASDVFSRAVFERYVDRVCADIAKADETAAEMDVQIDRNVDSIYMGGGTPTVLEPDQLKRMFDAVRAQFPVTPD